MAAILLATLAFAGQAEFEQAYSMAADDAGTEQFSVSLAMAMAQCTDKVPNCVSRVAGLREDDRQQRAWLAAHPPAQPAAPAKIEPKAAEPALAPVAETRVQRTVYAQPAYAVDRETGLEYVGGYGPRAPASPWRGVQVTDFQVVGKYQRACVRYGQGMVPMGPEIAFSESHDAGTEVPTCPAATIGTGTVLCVPSGSTIELASWDVYRQAWVVGAAFTCNNSTEEEVQWRTIDNCRRNR